MNVYDFDKTIYDGDSTINFYLFCLKRYPIIVTCLPRQIYAAIKYKLKKISKTEFKEQFYSFLSFIKNIDEEVVIFWNVHEVKIKEWYLEKQEEDDVIISASPHFLLQEICKRKHIKYLISSQVNGKNGIYDGINCYGDEKVNRFYNSFPNGEINYFYSDSYSDQPLANIAKESFIVNGNSIMPW